MTATEYQTLGIVLTVGGALFLVLSQLALSWWHRKMLREL